jgi:hypothetical protein
MTKYICTDCRVPKLATTENYYSSQIARSTDPNRTSLGKCIPCAKVYQAQYSNKLKEKKLSRARNPISPKKGTLYIIAPTDSNNRPYKIGITTGHDLSKRLTALQTSHWLDLKIYYKSPLLENVESIERMLHNKYKHKRVRGEWFNIDQNDIEDIMSECNKVVGCGSNRPGA